MSEVKKSATTKSAKLQLGLWFALAIAVVSCGTEYTPKPKGYNRIDLPPAKYQALTHHHPYWFEYCAYAKILCDSSRTPMPH